MPTIPIDLPEELARQAREAGLLEPDAIQGLLSDELVRRRGIRELLELRSKPLASPESSSDEEVRAAVQTEVDAHRAEKRATRARRG
jgi:hypothetical protein